MNKDDSKTYLNKDLINEIISLIKNDNFELAQDKVESLLYKFPLSDIILNLKGIIYLKKKEYEIAQNNFLEALKINPRFISAKLNLGIVYQSLGKNEEALNCFKDITKTNNTLPAVYNNMGFILYTQNKYSEAIKKLNKAIELKKNYTEAFFNLGMVYLNLKKYKIAIKFFNQSLVHDKKLVSVYYYLGECYKNIDDINKALSYYTLSHHERTNSRILECYFILNKKEEYQKLIGNISKNETDNRRIAAISAYISHQFEIINIYPFCQNPLNFVHKKNIKKNMENDNLEIQELIKEITEKKFTWELFGKTTVGGSSAYNLTQLGIVSLSKLQNILVKEISNYKENFKNENCVFIKKWPKKYKFNIWSNILKSEGYNTSHIHPAGWLSGVIYLKIPFNIKKNDAGIEFSLHGDNYPIRNKNIPTKTILPKIYDLVLFPSSLYHKTISFKSKDERMVIAFDIHKLS
jgi:uncharacterized protein (TIGR02466 family)|tara:strand:+ start:2397 stop:3788 length:1392 start_codon:yes stop_codon:yes gene_type:complete